MKKLSAGALVVFMLLFIFSSASALAADKAKKDVLAKIGTKEITKSEVDAYAGLYPEQQQWADGDRTVVCVVGSQGHLTTGTLKGSKR